MEGHIFTDDVIDDDYHKVLKAQLDRLSPSITKIIHHIASPGGSVYGGYKAYHVLKNAGKPIKSIIEGEAQSMATFMALAGDEIEILDPSIFMIHNPHSGMQGDADAMEGAGLELRNIENEMAMVYSAKTGIALDQIKSMMKKETRLTAQQAVDMKFADRKVGNRPLNNFEYNKLKAVALGKDMEGDKTAFEKLQDGINTIMAKLTGASADAGQPPVVVPPPAPKSLDLALKDGNTLQVPGEDGDLIGRSATVNGSAAPDGSHELADGRLIMTVGGIITSVQEGETPEEKALKAAQSQIQSLQAAADAAKAAELAAKQQASTAVQALASVKIDLENIQKQTVGDDDNPNKHMTTVSTGMKPIMHAVASPTAEAKEATIVFLNEHLGWLKQYYPKGHFEKAVEAHVTRNGPQAISILETNFNYTYPGILTTDIFYKPSLMNPALSDLFTVDQGIKSHKQYNLVNPISKILKPYTGCDRVFQNNRAFITNTTVRTKEFQVNESWCKDDFTNYLTGGYNVLAQEWLKTGIDSFDPSGTPINTVIDKVLSNALRLDVFRRASFAAGNSGDDDYNGFDGLWDRLIDSSGGSNYCVVRASATNGVGAVGFGTAPLASGAALSALESAYANSNILLKDWDNIYAQFSGAVSKPTFWVTRSVWDNYYNSLIGTGAVTEQAFDNLQKGLTTLTYKGYPVKPVSLWDQFLTESDNPLFATTRHLILFTTKDNHILGTEQASDLNKLEGWYERKDRKFYYEADMKMGYNYMHCDLQTIVY